MGCGDASGLALGITTSSRLWQGSVNPQVPGYNHRPTLHTKIAEILELGLKVMRFFPFCHIVCIFQLAFFVLLFYFTVISYHIVSCSIFYSILFFSIFFLFLSRCFPVNFLSYLSYSILIFSHPYPYPCTIPSLALS